jgi:hypothetical protein
MQRLRSLASSCPRNEIMAEQTIAPAENSALWPPSTWQGQGSREGSRPFLINMFFSPSFKSLIYLQHAPAWWSPLVFI